MKKTFVIKATLALAVVGVMLPIVSNASVLTFDDLNGSLQPIPNGYGGLNWNNFAVTNVSNYSIANGYVNGVVSGNNVAYNAWGDMAVTSGSQFDFNGAYLTAAWNDGLNVTVTGSLNGTTLYSSTITVNTYSPTWFVFNYAGINSLSFNSFGGTDVGYGGLGTHFAMDNFTFNQTATVPVPAAAWLLGSGLVGLMGVARRKAP